MDKYMFIDQLGNSLNVTYDGDVLVADQPTKVLVVLDPDNEIVVYNASEQSTRIMDDEVQLSQEKILDGLAYQEALTKLRDLRAQRAPSQQ
jgi:regulatory protein YycI of two-component signal transduction system YycFG